MFGVFSLEILRRESEKAVLVRQASIVFPHLFGKRYAHLPVKTQNLTDICGIDISHHTSTKILSLSLLFFLAHSVHSSLRSLNRSPYIPSIPFALLRCHQFSFVMARMSRRLRSALRTLYAHTRTHS